MKKILGLAAKARSGKDTAASILLANPGVAAYALADPLKRGCQALFALSDAETWDDTVKEIRLDAWGQSPREFFQRVGTEWMRGHDPLHWLKRADLEINGLTRNGPTPKGLTRSGVKDHPDTPPFPHAQSPINATSADAPFINAVSAIFGLPDQSWDTELCSVPDEYWKISPADMLSLLKAMTFRDFPDFIAQRAHHIQKSKVQNSEHEEGSIQENNPQKNERQKNKPQKSEHTQDIKPTFKAPFFDDKDKDVIIIKDIRFENEAHFIRSLNGEIWHIIRDNAESVKTHSSEVGIKIQSQDTVIHNNGTLENYTTAVGHAWARLKTKLAAENKIPKDSKNPASTPNTKTREQ